MPIVTARADGLRHHAPRTMLGPVPAAPITTQRLSLAPLTPDALDALIRRDAAALLAETGARFAEPVEPPPYMDDVLAFVRDRVRDHPAEDSWWSWLATHRESGEAIGSGGFGGLPDETGTVVIGYSLYPHYERQGFATEAATALALWALEQPGAERVVATIAPWNAPSVRVAEKLGMVAVGTAHDDEVGEVVIYELRREADVPAPVPAAQRA